MNNVEKHLNSLTVCFLALYSFHLGVHPILNFFGLSQVFFYCLPIFVAFSICSLFSHSLKSKNIKTMVELGLVLLFFISLVFLLSKTSHTMSRIAYSETNSYLQELIDSQSNELNIALYSDNHDKSRKTAHYLYSQFGVRIPFKNKDSNFVPFEPTQEEIDNRKKQQELEADNKEISILTRETAKTYKHMVDYMLISFSASFFLFMCITVYYRGNRT